MADDFVSDWDPDKDLLILVAKALAAAPEQGEWEWEDHCMGVAGIILRALHEAGIDLPEEAHLFDGTPEAHDG